MRSRLALLGPREQVAALQSGSFPPREKRRVEDDNRFSKSLLMSSEGAGTDADWDATAPAVVADPRTAYDRQRGRCPVARDATGAWNLLRHEDVRRAALDDVTFSSAVSRFRSVPNSMDGDEHRRFRAVVDRFLAPDRVAALVPMFRQVATEVVGALPRAEVVDVVHDLGAVIAVRAQSRWLGWPPELEQTLLTWVRDNQEASRSGQLERTRNVAARFDEIVRGEVIKRRATAAASSAATDVTSELMTATVEDPTTPAGQRLLTEAETVSVLRNWTAGDLGSIALALGVIVHCLARHSGRQADLRRSIHDAGALDLAIDEMLRLDDPFVLNRRITTRVVEIGGRPVPEGARVLLNWTAANRDPAVFRDPDAYRPQENRDDNLVYGVGRHACPGRAFATQELREAVVALLSATNSVTLADEDHAVREAPPLGGFARVPVVLR